MKRPRKRKNGRKKTAPLDDVCGCANSGNPEGFVLKTLDYHGPIIIDPALASLEGVESSCLVSGAPGSGKTTKSSFKLEEWLKHPVPIKYVVKDDTPHQPPTDVNGT